MINLYLLGIKVFYHNARKKEIILGLEISLAYHLYFHLVVQKCDKVTIYQTKLTYVTKDTLIDVEN